MNYLVLVADHIDQIIANSLKAELKRFDVRATFFSHANISSNVSIKVDAILCVGTSRIPRHKQLRSIPIFEITLESKKCEFLKKIKGVQKSTIYSDFPFLRNDAIDYFGCPLLDQFKRSNLSHKAESGRKIPIIHEFGNRLGKSRIRSIQAKLKKEMSYIDFPVVSLNLPEIESSLSQLSNANAAIVTSWMGELATLHFNIPYVFVDISLFFRKKKYSMQNAHANTTVVKEFSYKNVDGIASELEKILSNYQYAAGILEIFQKTKENIGNKPSIRSIAQDIISKLED